jgi:hypothetical protein
MVRSRNLIEGLAQMGIQSLACGGCLQLVPPTPQGVPAGRGGSSGPLPLRRYSRTVVPLRILLRPNPPEYRLFREEYEALANDLEGEGVLVRLLPATEVHAFPHAKHDDCVDALSCAHEAVTRYGGHATMSVPHGPTVPTRSIATAPGRRRAIRATSRANDWRNSSMSPSIPRHRAV